MRTVDKANSQNGITMTIIAINKAFTSENIEYFISFFKQKYNEIAV